KNEDNGEDSKGEDLPKKEVVSKDKNNTKDAAGDNKKDLGKGENKDEDKGEDKDKGKNKDKGEDKDKVG
ncbi:hypothetical protein EG327_006951, partial [Venturia inaequalis]